MTKFVRRTVAAVIAAAAIVFMTPATDAWAQGVCKLHYHTGLGIGKFPVNARKNARLNWQSKVLSHDGPRWTTPCGPVGQSCSRLGFRGYQCTFRARPSRR